MLSIRSFAARLAVLVVAAVPLGLHAQPIAASAVSKVLGVPGLVYKLDAKLSAAQTFTNQHYATAGGDPVIYLTTGPASEYTNLKAVNRDFEPVAGLGTEAVFSKGMAMMCARSSTKTACLMHDPLFFMSKPKPSMAQLKELLQLAI